ncbi:MAG: hypothetical protein U0694_17740 [Anaerolineae bacterium]
MIFPTIQQLSRRWRRLFAVVTVGMAVLLASCTGPDATDIPLPTLAELPTENVLPPEVEATRAASEQTAAPAANLSDYALNDTLNLEGVLSIDAATGVVTLRTDDGQTAALIVPPPLAQSLADQRVQLIGTVTDTGENLTLNVQSIVAAVTATTPAVITNGTAEFNLPPELGTQSAATPVNIAPNLTALQTYDALVQSGSLQGYGLLSISSEFGVWKISVLQPVDSTIMDFIVFPDGSVQQQASTTALPEIAASLVTLERQRLTVDSDAFAALLHERQLDTQPYTAILSASGQGATTWVAISSDGQVMLTVNAETGEAQP